MICLSNQRSVAKGSERVVYLHPSDPTALIKVLIPKTDQKLQSGFRKFTQTMFPALRHRAIAQEYREYARIMLLHADRQDPFPIAHMRGFVQTDVGLGCVSDRVTHKGGLAPTLAALANRDALDDASLIALNKMVQAVYDLGLRASDLSANNIVLGTRGHGAEAVLVDGFGDIHAIPIRTWSRKLNRIAIDRSFEKIAARTGLTWLSEQRQFASG